MRRTLVLLAAGACLLAAPAMAQDPAAVPETAAPAVCEAPTPPTVVDGATATMEQVLASKQAVTDFIATSDVYQACLVESVKVQREAAKANKTRFDNAIAKDVTAKISANQKDKEQAGKAFNEAVKAYKAANPA